MDLEDRIIGQITELEAALAALTAERDSLVVQLDDQIDYTNARTEKLAASQAECERLREEIANIDMERQRMAG